MFKKKPKTPEALPEGWEAKRWGKKTVYVNHVTKETQWEMPKKPRKAVPPRDKPKTAPPPSLRASRSPDDPPSDTKPSAAAAPAGTYDMAKVAGPAIGVEDKSETRDLPDGWREMKTKAGHTFYANDIEQITSWELPVAVAAPPAVVPQDEPKEFVDNDWSKNHAGIGEKYNVHDYDQTSTWEDKPREEPMSGSGEHKEQTLDDLTNASPSGGGEHQEQPLPYGWSKAVTPDGDVYYENHIDQTTSWDPPGWSKAAMPDGDVYYEHDVIQTTSWDPPVADPMSPT
eukprot:g9588.t1